MVEKDLNFFYLLFCFYILLAHLFGNSLFLNIFCLVCLCLCACVVNSGIKTFPRGTLDKVLGNFLGPEACMIESLDRYLSFNP